MDTRHPHQKPPAPPTMDPDDSPGSMGPAHTEEPSSSTPITSSSLQLLQTAIDLIKSHAEDARTNIEQLRVLLADRDTEPAAYRSLQRRRFLEERRELDAHRALWSTTQKVSAILRNDEAMFEAQQLSDSSLGLFHYPSIPEEEEQPSEKRVRTGRTVSLTLASKADYVYKKRASIHVLLHDPSSPATPLAPSTSPLRGSGTVTVFQPVASLNTSTARRVEEDRHKALLAEAAARIKDEEVAMPSYVGDLLSEFDAQANAPVLSLPHHLLPTASSAKKQTSKKQPASTTKKQTTPKRPPVAGGKKSSESARPRVSEESWVQVPLSTPTAQQSRTGKLKRIGSQKRFSGMFSKKLNTSTHGRESSAPATSPTVDVVGLGTGLEWGPSDDPFGLNLSAATEGETEVTIAAPTSAPTSPVNPSAPPSSFNHGRTLRSSNSMSTLPEDLAGQKTKDKEKARKRFSATSMLSLVTPNSHSHSASTSSERVAEDKEGITDKLRRRMSKIGKA